MELSQALNLAVENGVSTMASVIGGTAADPASAILNMGFGAAARFLPPEAAKLMGAAGPIVTEGLGKIMSGDLSSLGGMVSPSAILGMATQFLPPWAGDALAAGKAVASLASGDVLGAMDGLMSKFLPPELKAVYDALKKAISALGGIDAVISDVFDPKKPPEPSAAGPWAARLGDLAACPGGTGPIAAPCMPTVIIGGQPAARRSDIVICNGTPVDSITIGEPTVQIGGLFAARKGDDTAHQGKITTGLATVHIGKKRGQADMCAAGQCLATAAGLGVTTITGPAMAKSV